MALALAGSREGRRGLRKRSANARSRRHGALHHRLRRLRVRPVAGALDRRTRAAPAWLRPALFFAPLSLGTALMDLPASFVAGYTLERRFG